MSSVTLNTQGLQSLKRKLKTAEKARVDVGVFASHDARDDGESNLEIANKMEFGSAEVSSPSDEQARARGRMGKHRPTWGGNPARSFVGMPITTELPKVVRGESGELAAAFVADGAKAMLERVGFMGEAVIQDAFDTGGFGTWPANSEATVQWKDSDKPLIDSKQLRGAISSRVK